MKLKMERIEVYKDKKKEFRFRVVANNNKIVAQSEGYKSKQGCIKGVYALCNIVNPPYRLGGCEIIYK